MFKIVPNRIEYFLLQTPYTYIYLVKTDKMMLICLEFTLRVVEFSSGVHRIVKLMHFFVISPLHQFSKFNNFLWVPMLIFRKNISNCLPPLESSTTCTAIIYISIKIACLAFFSRLLTWSGQEAQCFPTSSVGDVFMVHFNNVIFYWCYNDILWVFYSCSNFDTFSSNISLSLQQPELW